MDSGAFGAGNISLLGWTWRERTGGKQNKNSFFWEVFPAGILGRSIKSLGLMEEQLGPKKKREKRENSTARGGRRVWGQNPQIPEVLGKIPRIPHFWGENPWSSAFWGFPGPFLAENFGFLWDVRGWSSMGWGHGPREWGRVRDLLIPEIPGFWDVNAGGIRIPSQPLNPIPSTPWIPSQSHQPHGSLIPIPSHKSHFTNPVL